MVAAEPDMLKASEAGFVFFIDPARHEPEGQRNAHTHCCTSCYTSDGIDHNDWCSNFTGRSTPERRVSGMAGHAYRTVENYATTQTAESASASSGAASADPQPESTTWDWSHWRGGWGSWWERGWR